MASTTPCVGIRAVPVGEAMMACVLADHFCGTGDRWVAEAAAITLAEECDGIGKLVLIVVYSKHAPP
jgi:hypothetical protein